MFSRVERGVTRFNPVPRPAATTATTTTTAREINPLLSEALPPGRTQPGIRRGPRSHCWNRGRFHGRSSTSVINSALAPWWRASIMNARAAAGNGEGLGRERENRKDARREGNS